MPAASKTKTKNTKPSKKIIKKKAKKKGLRPKKKPELPSINVELLELDDEEEEEEGEGKTGKNKRYKPPEARTLRYCRRCLGMLKGKQQAFCSENCQRIYQGNFNVFFKKTSRYKEEYCDEVLKEYMVWVEEMNQSVYVESARGVLGNLKQIHVPSITSYGCYIGISKPTMMVWRQQNPVFDDAMKMLHSYQEFWITNKVSEGLMEARVANLLLGHNHGIIQKNETENKHVHLMMGFVDEVYAQVEAMEQGQLPAASENEENA